MSPSGPFAQWAVSCKCLRLSCASICFCFSSFPALLQILADSIYACAGSYTVTIPSGTSPGERLLVVSVQDRMTTPWRSPVQASMAFHVQPQSGGGQPSQQSPLLVAAVQLPSSPRRPGSTVSLPLLFTGFEVARVTVDDLASLKAALQRDLAAALRAFGVAGDDVGIDWLRSGPLQSGQPEPAPDTVFSISVMVAATASPSRATDDTRVVAKQAVGMLTSVLRNSSSALLPRTIEAASNLMNSPVVISADIINSCRRVAEASSTISSGCASWIAADSKVSHAHVTTLHHHACSLVANGSFLPPRLGVAVASSLPQSSRATSSVCCSGSSLCRHWHPPRRPLAAEGHLNVTLVPPPSRSPHQARVCRRQRLHHCHLCSRRRPQALSPLLHLTWCCLRR